MTKQALRKQYLQQRNGLTFPEREKFTDLILIHFQRLTLPFLQSVHTYLAAPSRSEVDTSAIIRFLEFQHQGLRIVVPKTGEPLEHFELTEDTELVLSSFGIPEPVSGKRVAPVEIDLALVPLLAFDRRGYRVGYGKGHYDRFLPHCRPDVITVGLSFFEAVDSIDDINEFDIPLKYCVTPNGVYDFT